MLEVYDRALKNVAILEHALHLHEEVALNAVSYFYFSLPDNDSKVRHCQPFCYVRYNGGDIYRIMPTNLTKSETGLYTYQCEHAIATLMDKVLFGYHVVGNKGYYTNQVLQYVLDQQLVKHWVLGVCEFNRQFEYGWEQENLLSALFSVPRPFSEKYMWTYDFDSYPWKVNLKRLDETALPALYIRDKKNLQLLTTDADPTALTTRLYPLGYGEGVNQLGIGGVNNGLPYIQSPQRYIDKYGIIEKVWIDRRYEDAASLLAAAQKMLAELQEPLVQYTVQFSELGLSSFDGAKIGDIVRIIDTETGTDVQTYITGINRDYGDITASEITIANKSVSIAETVADLADRQRIEMTYAQGATNLYGQSIQGNADQKNGLKLNFYIPAEMRIINQVQAKIQVDSFRAYSKATSAGGGFYGTTGAGGGDVETTSTELSASYTSGCQPTSGWANDINGIAYENNPHNHGVPDGTGLKTADDEVVWFASSGAHEHDVVMRDHKHIVNSLEHNHSVQLEDHTHEVELEEHEHDITPGIYEFGNPTAFTLYVNGVRAVVINDTMTDIDLTKYLLDNGTIPRGVWHELEVRPNDLAYISVDMFTQGFIQSRGDNTV